MAMSKNGQKRLEKNLDEKADSGRSEKRPDIKAPEQEKLLAGYPGAALLVADDGSILYSNAKAAGLEALIQHDAAPEIKNLIEKASSSSTSARKRLYRLISRPRINGSGNFIGRM